MWVAALAKPEEVCYQICTIRWIVDLSGAYAGGCVEKEF
jgi:hypothetical protein